jgi:hypothetical protein
MTVIDIEIDGKEYKVANFNSARVADIKTKGSNYMPLVIALLQRITAKQLKTIISNNKVILFLDLAGCFSYRAGLKNECDNCICGKDIWNVNRIENYETGEEHNIGSECIHNWDLHHFNLMSMKYDEMKLINEKRGTTELITLCHFCNRNTTKTQCRNCAPKIICKSVFADWKRNAKINRELKRKVISQWQKYKKDNLTPRLKRFVRRCESIIEAKRETKRLMLKAKVERENKLKRRVISQWILYKTPIKRFITRCRHYIQLKIERMKYEMANYTYLLVPYEDRRRANLYGAFYSKDNKKWFAPAMNPQLERYNITYLSVPFRLKDEAKANGAKWDMNKKQWFCNGDALSKSEFLQKWA